MTLPLFLQAVDHLCEMMSEKQTAASIHELARVLPETKRNDFLDILKRTLNATGDVSDEFEQKSASDKDARSTEQDDLEEQLSECSAALARIEKGELSLDSEYNEQYDDWYDSDSDELVFEDPHDLLPDIQTAIHLLHVCVDREEYERGFKLADTLSTLEINVEGDYMDCDGEPMDVGELYSCGLLSGTFEDLVRESLFTAYMANALKDKAPEMLRIMYNYNDYSVGLEEILQMGSSDLPQFDEFLPLWIDVLGNEPDYYAKRYLEEAQSMLTDQHQQLEMARKYADTHPELYLQYLQAARDSFDQTEIYDMNGVGIEALRKIPANYRIRAKIALITAEYGWKMNDQNLGQIEYCWREAFLSDSTSVNYLRIRLYDTGWKKWAAIIRKDYEALYMQSLKAGDTYGYYGSGKTNQLSLKGYCWLLFWEQRFKKVIDIGMQMSDGIGWSSVFMKEGLAAFLLLLFEEPKGSEDTERFDVGELPKGLSRMLNDVIEDCAFNKTEFVTGLGKYADDDKNNPLANTAYFWKLFQKWKGTFDLSPDWGKSMANQIHKWISLRVKGIVGGQKRKYYDECAGYIAAFGEVLESLGEKSAKTKLIMDYRQEYPRHRAFHQELKKFN